MEWWDFTMSTSITVFEEERPPSLPSGLLDAHSTPLHRVSTRRLGFDLSPQSRAVGQSDDLRGKR